MPIAAAVKPLQMNQKWGDSMSANVQIKIKHKKLLAVVYFLRKFKLPEKWFVSMCIKVKII
jgi:hypothetical protein